MNTVDFVETIQVLTPEEVKIVNAELDKKEFIVSSIGFEDGKTGEPTVNSDVRSSSGCFLLGKTLDKFDFLLTDSLSDCGPSFLVVPTVALSVSCKVFACSGVFAFAMASTILCFCRSFKEASLKI